LCNQSVRTLGKVTQSAIEDDSPELHSVLLLDSLGQRYGCLPSEVLSTATTFDVYVLDVTLSYEEKIRKKMERKHGRTPDRHFEETNLDDLAERVKKFKEKKNGSENR